MCREIGRVAAFMIDLFNVFVKKSSAHTHSICHRLFLVLPVKHPISLCFALSAFFFKFKLTCWFHRAAFGFHPEQCDFLVFLLSVLLPLILHRPLLPYLLGLGCC